MADISIQRILATKYFLLQIQTLVIMILVGITNYNSALLQHVMTSPYLFIYLLIYLFICVRLQDALRAVTK